MRFAHLALVTLAVLSLSVVTLSSGFAGWDAPPSERTSLDELAAFVAAGAAPEISQRAPDTSAALGLAAVVTGFIGARAPLTGLSHTVAVWHPGPHGPTDRAALQATVTAQALSRAQVAASHDTTASTWFSLPFAVRRGALRRPVAGWVYHEFGSVQIPDLTTNLRHRGVTYSVEPGAVAHAVAPAIVAFAGEVDGHGQVVILNHGDGYHTVYAFLDALFVEHDTMVGEREPLGQTGTRSPHGGERLHFQIRRFSDALDPADWIGRSGVAGTVAMSPPDY